MSSELALKANQLQDLTDVLPQMLRVAAGHELTFTIRGTAQGQAATEGRRCESRKRTP